MRVTFLLPLNTALKLVTAIGCSLLNEKNFLVFFMNHKSDEKTLQCSSIT